MHRIIKHIIIQYIIIIMYIKHLVHSKSSINDSHSPPPKKPSPILKKTITFTIGYNSW